jgi:hypothetical protein
MPLDRTVYITPDGVAYDLNPPTYIFLEDGYGMPPIEYVTQRGPFQHGETVKAFFLRPRVIQLVIRKNGCSRNEYWAIRNGILDMLRPGRQGLQPTPGTLRKYLSNGSVREYQVFVSEGPRFPPHDINQWDEFSVQDIVRFTAYDPRAVNPVSKQSVFLASAVQGVFPITFPWQTSSLGIDGVINYGGTWITYPTLTLVGPLAGPTITNVTTGEKIQLGTTILGGQNVIIDLAYGRKTVVLNDGSNYIGTVTPDSDIATFHLQPGNNTIRIQATGTGAASSIGVQWFERFIGF